MCGVLLRMMQLSVSVSMSRNILAHGTVHMTQVAACFFLGSCFTALKDVPQTEGAQEDQSNHLTQRSFLSMVDSRIGLTRFVEMLRRPLTASRYVLPSPFGRSYECECVFCALQCARTCRYRTEQLFLCTY